MKNPFEELTAMLKQLSLENLLSLKWAAKLLALILSIIAIGLVLFLLISVALGTVMYFIENLPYFIFLLVGTIILTIVVLLGGALLPSIRNLAIQFLTTGPGKKILSIFVAVLWSFVLFHHLITERPVSVEIALTLVVSGILLWVVSMTQFLTTKGRSQILWAVASYLCIVPLYAGIYNLLFLAKPLSFRFSPDIAETEGVKDEFYSKLSQLRELERQLYFATLIEGHPEAGFNAAVASRQDDESPQKITESLSIRFFLAPDPGSDDEMLLNCYYNGEESDLVLRGGTVRHPEQEIVVDMYLADSVEEFHLKSGELIESYESKIDRTTRQIEGVLSGNPEWNAVDFIYFSSMNQISANFGEIIPNSDLVRIIVSSQAFLGLIDAGFAIMIFKPKASNNAS